jgi:tRNA threonylcarbamoyladenosine biosynthesis protein TsaE
MSRSGRVFRHVSLEQLPEVAKVITEHLKDAKVWLLAGDLGAGKTTLVKILGQLLKVDDVMSSPSFSIVNEYHSTSAGKIFHFDFYRIRNETEALDIGVEEYLDSGYPCFIEWPEKIAGLVPAVRGEVTITIENENTRTIAISVHGEEENRV